MSRPQGAPDHLPSGTPACRPSRPRRVCDLHVGPEDCLWTFIQQGGEPFHAWLLAQIDRIPRRYRDSAEVVSEPDRLEIWHTED